MYQKKLSKICIKLCGLINLTTLNAYPKENFYNSALLLKKSVFYRKNYKKSIFREINSNYFHFLEESKMNILLQSNFFKVKKFFFTALYDLNKFREHIKCPSKKLIIIWGGIVCSTIAMVFFSFRLTMREKRFDGCTQEFLDNAVFNEHSLKRETIEPKSVRREPNERVDSHSIRNENRINWNNAKEDTSWNNAKEDTSWNNAKEDTSWNNAKEDTSWNNAKEDTSWNNAKQDTSWNNAKEDTSWNNAKQDTSWNNAKQDTSWNNAKQDTSWNNAKQDTSWNNAKQDTSWDNAKQDTSWDNAKQDTSWNNAKHNTPNEKTLEISLIMLGCSPLEIENLKKMEMDKNFEQLSQISLLFQKKMEAMKSEFEKDEQKFLEKNKNLIQKIQKVPFVVQKFNIIENNDFYNSQKEKFENVENYPCFELFVMVIDDVYFNNEFLGFCYVDALIRKSKEWGLIYSEKDFIQNTRIFLFPWCFSRNHFLTLAFLYKQISLFEVLEKPNFSSDCRLLLANSFSIFRTQFKKNRKNFEKQLEEQFRRMNPDSEERINFIKNNILSKLDASLEKIRQVIRSNREF